MAVSMNAWDKLRFMPSKVFEPLRNSITGIIKSTWGNIQKEEHYGGSYQYKLKGNPWYPSGVEGITSRLLILDVINYLLSQGWKMALSTDVMRKEADTSTIFFVRDYKPLKCNTGFIFPTDWNRLRLMGNLPITGEEVKTIAAGCGILVSRIYQPQARVTEIKFSGNVWAGGTPNNRVKNKQLMIGISNLMAKKGWICVDSIDTSKKMSAGDNKYPIDASGYYSAIDQCLFIHRLHLTKK
eukprot:UN25070